MRDNAERASRAEAALLAYIDETGDARDANEFETWLGDLLCDLRHLCRFMRVDFNPNAGEMNFEAEREEDPRGHFDPAHDWHALADIERRRKRREREKTRREAKTGKGRAAP